MKRRIINIIILVALILINCSCEIKVEDPIYIYNQNENSNNDSYFVDKSKNEQLMDLCFYPTKSFEDKRIGKIVDNYIPDAKTKEKIKYNIDIFLKGFYYVPYSNNNIDNLNEANLKLSSDLRNNSEVYNYFKNLKMKVIELESQIDIESMKLEGKINKYINDDNKNIIRVPCQFKLDLEGEKASKITESYPTIFKGNSNNIELFLYFVQNDSEYELYSWIESFRDPFQTVYYSKNGIEVLENTQESLWNIEEDYDKLKVDFDNIEYINDLSESEYNKLFQLNCDFLESFFNYNSNQKLKYMNKNISLFKDDKNAIEKWVDELDSNEVKLTYLGQKDKGYIAYKGKKSDSTYYCVIINNAYEAYSHSLSINLTNRKIPTGSLFVHSLFVFKEKTENGFELYDWGLGGFSRKTPGFGYSQTLQDFN
jgi:hypothetical protein